MKGKIIIGSSERNINDIEPNWINDQVNRRKSDDVPICVRVEIQHNDIDIALATADCPRGVGGSRILTQSENEMIDLWNKLHLNDDEFSSGNLVAFIKQLGI